MIESKAELKRLAEVAVYAAREAGKIVQSRSDTCFEVERKVAGDSLASQVVTEVDRIAEERILQCLEKSCTDFDLGVLTEEREDDGSRFEKPAFWCIDPLDGTLPFVEGRAGYAVSIALVSREGAPLIGVVYDPRSEVMYEAVLGCGARRDGEEMRIESETAQLSVFSDRSSREDSKHKAVIDSLAQEFGGSGVSQIYGYGAALNACSVSGSPCSCYFKLPKEKRGGGSVWDFAATACIVTEAGGIVSDLAGEPLLLNPRGALFMNRRGVLYASSRELAQRIRSAHGQKT
ncbi:inositol monophosphatase family protein [Pelagicoccus enzymogenes]|uniref:3'(2'),5'-bisphosphate nucleotidase CysQ family protein n=1 Tax=Pelagicoccus enzymogenes TaxID=2773457 RepID=UPI00280CDC33|nr:inositol monophosphatase family protein [Pelagicoccus enzymogenes]MDQ8200237.1 inositol monophosphatase family protein [Pelagicoccus enzymogenes]